MIVACVWNGNKYPISYVERLREGVKRHLKVNYDFVCITDKPSEFVGSQVNDIIAINEYDLSGWWAKMRLFEKSWRKNQRVLYLDLDTAVVGDLTPLALLGCEFGICANFTKRALKRISFPCSYGSCVMTIAPNRMDNVWEEFADDKNGWMDFAGPYGDQLVIEKLAPKAILLQDVLPENFFLGYRNATEEKPKGCSLVIFAGRNKPDNCEKKWIKDEWIS